MTHDHRPMSSKAMAQHINLITDLVQSLLEHAAARVLEEKAKSRTRKRKGLGVTLRPGVGTPLWNELRSSVHIATRKYGDQAQLGRILGLPRQRVNNYLTGGTQMPDAERTLLLLGWLAAKRAAKPLS